MAKTTNINLPDGSVLQLPAWATETTLVGMAQQVQRTNVLTSQMLDGVKEMADVDEEVIKAINNTITATSTNADTNKQQAKGQSNMVLGAVGAVKDTASFFGDAEKPMSSMVGAVKELTDKMSGPGGKKGLANLTKKFPAMGKFFDKFGGSLNVVTDVALAWAGWNAAKFEQFAEVQQKMIDAGSIFYASADEFDKLYEQSFRSGVTYNAFADTISNYGATMTALGGNVSKGSKRFLGMYKQLSDVTDSMGDLGMQNTELMNQYAAYLEMARLTGQIDQRSMKDKGRELGESFTNLVVESTALASLTKLSRNEALAAQLAAMSDVRLAAGTGTLRKMGFDDQAKTIEEFAKQFAVLNSDDSLGAGQEIFGNIAEALNQATANYAGNIKNFNIIPSLDTETVAVIEQVLPGLINTINTKVRDGSLAEEGVSSFLLRELNKANVEDQTFTMAGVGISERVLNLRSSIIQAKKNYVAVIDKDQRDMANINDETKKKLESSGVTVEAMNDAAKMFLTAQEAITLDINSLSTGVESVAAWFEKHTGTIKEQATSFFNPDPDADDTKVNESSSTTSSSSSNPLPTSDGDLNEQLLKKKKENENLNNAVVTPPLPTTAVYNRTNATLNEQLTSYTDHVKMLDKNLTEAKKKDIALYQEQISLIEAEIDARNKKEKMQLREKLKYFSQ